ncbi:hypothetical protein KIW84_053043 [Lathyrus oleraceus]|uniref:Threonyl-tRNA synthetase n=1 Tax=Pisum sativum TaxID=3888 RepID=A0A9D4WQD0_PEA|nr:hypothetical protein KIW84_053043 [Pisum sativum]
MASFTITLPTIFSSITSSSIHFLKSQTRTPLAFGSLRSPAPTLFNRKFTTLAVATRPSQPAALLDSDDQNRVVLPTNESSNNLLKIRHTCAHVMAMAVQKLYPKAKVTIGPWIENGFYYDFDMEPLTDKDLKKIKKEMDRIISKNFPLVREEVSRDEAHRRILALNEPYKMEILEGIKEEPITIYHIGLNTPEVNLIIISTSSQVV